MTHRCTSMLATFVLASACLAGCGSSSSGEIVAQVRGVGPISRATLEHWIPVEAVVTYQEEPTQPVPKGVIPDPPRYTACIAYLKVTPQKIVETGPKPSTLDLKRKCAHKQKELVELTLNTLIGWDWTIGVGMELGLKLSDAEVKHRLEVTSRSSYPKPGEFARYLRFTHQTVSDMLFRSKVQLFEVKLLKEQAALQKPGPNGLTVQQRIALAKFARTLPPSKQWAARTTCHRGYVVSACKEYRGSESPGLPN